MHINCGSHVLNELGEGAQWSCEGVAVLIILRGGETLTWGVGPG